ncbi:hypothetical protein [Luteimonas sp. R10]|uniref:hypothetical protein n=1 Tax=Luteimonas sp. R10 TaxID=3108176 RepID=UPI003087910D|nr:hypothetical protein U3649_02055 [Luteimonas sp. R10]
MSSIGSDPHLNVTGLDRLGGQAALDDLQRQQGPQQAREVAREVAREAPQAPAVDPGEQLLAAGAWDGVGPGARLLGGDLGFENDLGALDLSQAADRATDAILDALA